jgi:MFS family permease
MVGGWSALGASPLARLALATVVVVGAFGMLNPVLAVRLQQAGYSASAIGLFAMLPFAGVALMVPLMPWVFARLGLVRAYRLGLALEACATVGYALSDDYALWCVLAGVGGLGAAAVWNGTEALIAFNAPPAQRGRITGIYQTALGAVLAAGPFVPGVLPLSPDALTLLAVGLLVSGWLMTAGRGVGALRASHAGAASSSLVAAIRQAPALVLLAVAGGVFEAGLGSITTALGAGTGLSLAAAASIAGAVGVGSLLLQYPSGWLADRMAPRPIFQGAGLLLLCGSLLFLLAPRWPAVLWISAALWGAVGGAMYTLLMVRVAHDFAGSSTVTGTAAMITGYTLGGAAGPLVSGVVIDASGMTGQALWLSALAALAIAAASRLSPRPPSALD